MGDLQWQQLRRVPDRRLARHPRLISVRTAAGQFLVKRYNRPANEASLRAMVAWREELSQTDRRQLDDISAWPRDIVWDGDDLVGPMVPLAGDEFFEGGRPRTLSVAPGQPESARRAAADLIDVVLWFHEREAVVNDLQPDNVLCTMRGDRVLLVDCDAMVGPWGAVSEVAAPAAMWAVVPGLGAPDVHVDRARLAWTLTWLILDDFALVNLGEPDYHRLAASVGVNGADLLLVAGQGAPTNTADWRRLATALRA